MSDTQREVSMSAEREALASIAASEASAERAVVEPRWFITLTAITIFVVFAGIRPEGPNGLLPIIVLSVVRAVMVRSRGAVPLSTGRGAWRWAVGVGALTVFYLAVVYLFRIGEVSLAPPIGGTIATTAYVLVAEAERRRALSESGGTDER